MGLQLPESFVLCLKEVSKICECEIGTARAFTSILRGILGTSARQGHVVIRMIQSLS